MLSRAPQECCCRRKLGPSHQIRLEAVKLHLTQSGKQRRVGNLRARDLKIEPIGLKGDGSALVLRHLDGNVAAFSVESPYPGVPVHLGGFGDNFKLTQATLRRLSDLEPVPGFQ